MCEQVYLIYQCGCRAKGEFKQCDRLYDQQLSLQCDVANIHESTVRNYCPKHLPKESEATTAYIGYVQQS